MTMNTLGRQLIIVGLLIAGSGAVLLLLGKIPGLGRLPGDIVVRRSNFTLYVPIVSAIVVSALINIVLWLLRRF